MEESIILVVVESVVVVGLELVVTVGVEESVVLVGMLVWWRSHFRFIISTNMTKYST